MSRFWKPNPVVRDLIDEYNKVSIEEVAFLSSRSRFWHWRQRVYKWFGKDWQSQLPNNFHQQMEELLGVRPNIVLHYKGDELFLESQDDVSLMNCTLVTEGQFFEMLP